MFSFSIIKNDYKTTEEVVSNLKENLEIRGWIYDENNPKYVFIFGGDGTFLKAVSIYKENIKNIEFIPFKSGGIGFYTNKNRVEKIDLTIESIEKQKYELNNFELLEIKTSSKNLIVANEVKIINEKSPLYVEIYVNNEFLEKFHGTGIVVSTSNGSSGYMKSAGGAVILSKNSHIYQMQELVPVSTNKFRTLNAPLILNDEHILKFKFEKHSNEIMIIDTIEYPIDEYEIEIKPSKINIKVVTDIQELKNNSKIKILRDIFIKDKEVIE
ncbi:NAD(+)/NADH kinase [Spiroplasma diminutum]|uniref:Inorganic polyphosphate/ATP-NAD kinase n=1 Tax=Spiroplasma diminutum CUAS-1 TaxID=1276221 RepID=S5LZA6_9MOLU|nr:NAD(+)/NADH kinase [Spiroplasma diminutum]AGR41911.1 inorganic polyphosphate/ATP-NAD kinase [Spiroplasma diminutum CUAS-1]